jgi:D-ribose pyranose/furanose isomerase RbsD
LSPTSPASASATPHRTIDREGIEMKKYGARFAVRTGEFTPYSNVIVICGVPF